MKARPCVSCEQLIERQQSLAKEVQRCMCNAGAYLPERLSSVEDPGIDRRCYPQLYCATNVDADRRAAEVEKAQLQPAAATGADRLGCLCGLYGRAHRPAEKVGHGRGGGRGGAAKADQ